ncbi:MAG: hypothetical protein ACXAC8_14095 [Candidatus Hodarchaeales archaeon]|jgi:hypothetical protein
MSNLEVPFNIGYKLGEMARQAEIASEFAERDSDQGPRIEVIHVVESLKYISHELALLNISETLLEELSDYLNNLTGGKFSAEKKENLDKSDDLLLTRIKKSFKSRGKTLIRDMKPKEVKTLAIKLQIWRDRISNEFTRIETR